VVEPSGLSLAQYNALRIIRGAGTGGIPTLSIRERMIEEGTTITRLLDKLEDAGLIRRERTYPDRRQVLCFVTNEGRKLLDTLDPDVNAADEDVVSALTEAQLDEFISLLDIVRDANAERGAPRTAVTAPNRRAAATKSSVNHVRLALINTCSSNYCLTHHFHLTRTLPCYAKSFRPTTITAP
jgi:DNA-binding MarR family transcriptional regulator